MWNCGNNAYHELGMSKKATETIRWRGRVVLSRWGRGDHQGSQTNRASTAGISTAVKYVPVEAAELQNPFKDKHSDYSYREQKKGWKRRILMPDGQIDLAGAQKHMEATNKTKKHKPIHIQSLVTGQGARFTQRNR